MIFNKEKKYCYKIGNDEFVSFIMDSDLPGPISIESFSNIILKLFSDSSFYIGLEHLSNNLHYGDYWSNWEFWNFSVEDNEIKIRWMNDFGETSVFSTPDDSRYKEHHLEAATVDFYKQFSKVIEGKATSLLPFIEGVSYTGAKENTSIKLITCYDVTALQLYMDTGGYDIITITPNGTLKYFNKDYPRKLEIDDEDCSWLFDNCKDGFDRLDYIFDEFGIDLRKLYKLIIQQV
jgi:hypothetical protein